MLNVEEQTARIEQLYRQLTGTEPKHPEQPLAAIPPDADPEQFVMGSLQRLQAALQSVGGPGIGALPTATPRMNILEGDREWCCAVELPGVKKESLSVQIRQGMLNVTATRTVPGLNGEPRRLTYSEVPACRFERQVPLPPFAQLQTVESRFDAGVLVIKCSKEPSAIRKDLKIDVA